MAAQRKPRKPHNNGALPMTKAKCSVSTNPVRNTEPGQWMTDLTPKPASARKVPPKYQRVRFAPTPRSSSESEAYSSCSCEDICCRSPRVTRRQRDRHSAPAALPSLGRSLPRVVKRKRPKVVRQLKDICLDTLTKNVGLAWWNVVVPVLK